MDNSDSISTGEAARCIGVSRSTLIRKFDAGEIEGHRNPVTGVRQVFVSSVVKFMRTRGLPTDKLFTGLRRIVLAAGNRYLHSAVMEICSRDARLDLRSFSRGSDALAVCSRECPDLFLVGDDLPDIACSDVVDSLRRQADLKGTKILCYATQKDACACRESAADVCMDETDLDSPRALTRQIYGLLCLSPGAEPKGERGHRRWHRTAVEIPARVDIYRRGSQRSKRPSGKGILRNASMGGAFVSDLSFEGGLPGTPFRVLLRTDSGMLRNWQAYCQLVRLESNGTLSAGLRFVRMSKPARERLHQLVG